MRSRILWCTGLRTGGRFLQSRGWWSVTVRRPIGSRSSCGGGFTTTAVWIGTFNTSRPLYSKFPTSVLSIIYFIVICEKFVQQSCPLFCRHRVTVPVTREHWEYTNSSHKGVTSPGDSRCSWLVEVARCHGRLAWYFLGQQKRGDKRRAWLTRRFRKHVEPSCSGY